MTDSRFPALILPADTDLPSFEKLLLSGGRLPEAAYLRLAIRGLGESETESPVATSACVNRQKSERDLYEPRGTGYIRYYCHLY